MGEIVAIIDTETNFSNELISVGVVAADAGTFQVVNEYYGIFDPACRRHAMFSHVLEYRGVPINRVGKSSEIFEDLLLFLELNGVRKVFAYNAKFDYGHLGQLQHLEWFDIMRLAAYRQYNERIPEDAPCCKTGRLKSSYGVEDVYRMLSGDCGYREVHNALTDARDEMRIMQMLGKTLDEYEIARIN